jgi:peptide/nickel transport system substrate-binding protein
MGAIGVLRFNHMYPPFNNVAVRRLVLACVDQQTYMQSVAGAETSYYRTGSGLFTPETPMATTAGTEGLTARTDFETVKKELAAAGYNGEKIVLIAASTIPGHAAQSAVADEMLRRMGFNVDYQTQEFASITRRRVSKEQPDKGGWNATVFESTALLNVFLPANFLIRGGTAAGLGWPDLPRIEALREDWLNADAPDDRKRLAAEMQIQFFRDVPHVPLGEYFSPTCFRKDIVDIQPGWPVMHSVRRV